MEKTVVAFPKEHVIEIHGSGNVRQDLKESLTTLCRPPIKMTEWAFERSSDFQIRSSNVSPRIAGLRRVRRLAMRSVLPGMRVSKVYTVDLSKPDDRERSILLLRDTDPEADIVVRYSGTFHLVKFYIANGENNLRLLDAFCERLEELVGSFEARMGKELRDGGSGWGI